MIRRRIPLAAELQPLISPLALMRPRPRSSFTPPPGARQRQAIAIGSVMFASLLAALVPAVAVVPIAPPLGFLMLLAWRLPRAGRFPIWLSLPLGLFDDICSGDPLGTAMALWTIAFLAFDAVDRRMLWRGYWQDWAVAAAAILVERLGTLIIIDLTGGATPLWLIAPQVIIAALGYPMLARVANTLDRWGTR